MITTLTGTVICDDTIIIKEIHFRTQRHSVSNSLSYKLWFHVHAWTQPTERLTYLDLQLQWAVH